MEPDSPDGPAGPATKRQCIDADNTTAISESLQKVETSMAEQLKSSFRTCEESLRLTLRQHMGEMTHRLEESESKQSEQHENLMQEHLKMNKRLDAVEAKISGGYRFVAPARSSGSTSDPIQRFSDGVGSRTSASSVAARPSTIESHTLTVGAWAKGTSSEIVIKMLTEIRSDSDSSHAEARFRLHLPEDTQGWTDEV